MLDKLFWLCVDIILATVYIEELPGKKSKEREALIFFSVRGCARSRGARVFLGLRWQS